MAAGVIMATPPGGNRSSNAVDLGFPVVLVPVAFTEPVCFPVWLPDPVGFGDAEADSFESLVGLGASVLFSSLSWADDLGAGV
jgi:hypothetical protein